MAHVHAVYTCHDRKDLLHQLKVVGLVELRRIGAVLKGFTDLEEQVQPCVCDVPLHAHANPRQM